MELKGKRMYLNFWISWWVATHFSKQRSSSNVLCCISWPIHQHHLRSTRTLPIKIHSMIHVNLSSMFLCYSKLSGSLCMISPLTKPNMTNISFPRPPQPISRDGCQSPYHGKAYPGQAQGSRIVWDYPGLKICATTCHSRKYQATKRSS